MFRDFQVNSAQADFYVLNDSELDSVGGGLTATQLAGAAAGIAGAGGAMVGVCPPAGAAMLAVAATAELVAFVMTA